MTNQQSGTTRTIIGIICTLLLLLTKPLQKDAFSETAEAVKALPSIMVPLLLTAPVSNELPVGINQITTTTEEGNANPSISADGTRIAFQSNCNPLGTNADGNSEIFLFDTTAGLTTQVTTTTGGTNELPSIGADGTRIAFQSNCNPLGTNADGNSEVFIFDTTTATLAQVTNSIGGTNAFASINADGTQVAFTSNADYTGGNADGNTEIFIYDATTGLTQVTSSAGNVNADPSISADGTRVAFVSNADYTGGNADGNYEVFMFYTTSFIQVTDSPIVTQNINSSISGDGTQIAIVKIDQIPYPVTTLFIVDTGTLSTTLVTSSETTVDNPSINADGTKVAFTSNADYTGGNADGNTEIFIYDTTTGFAQVTDSASAIGNNNGGPSINADGTRVAFTSNADYTGGNADGNVEIFLDVRQD